jgi:hypothetical protein
MPPAGKRKPCVYLFGNTIMPYRWNPGASCALSVMGHHGVPSVFLGEE